MIQMVMVLQMCQEYYNEKHDRKVVEDSWNIIDLVKHPNKFSAIIAGIFVLVIVLIILLYC